MALRDVLPSHAAGLSHEIQERIACHSTLAIQYSIDAFPHEAGPRRSQASCKRLEAAILLLRQEDLHASHEELPPEGDQGIVCMAYSALHKHRVDTRGGRQL